MTTVYLTLDFFLRDWNSADGAAWLCLQPFVTSDSMSTYIKDDSKTGNNCLFTLINQQQLPPGVPSDMPPEEAWNALKEKLVPVNLPDDVDIELQIAEPIGAQTVALLRNRRVGTRKIRNAEAAKTFRLANSDPRTDQSKIKDLPSGAFAASYNQSLRDAWDDAADNTARQIQVRSMLELGFMGGQTRIIPPLTFDDLEETHLLLVPMTEPDSEAMAQWMMRSGLNGAKRASLHSLCGLMLRVGGKIDLPRLNALPRFVLALSYNDALTERQSQHLINSGTVMEAHARAFFRKLAADTALTSPSPNIPQVPLLPWATWDPTWRQNVYAQQNLLAYPPVSEITSGAYFRRNDPDSGKEKAAWIRLVVGYDTQRGTVPFPLGVDQVSFQPYQVQRVHIAPYRDVRQSLPDAPSLPLRLTADIENDEQRKKFYKRFLLPEEPMGNDPLSRWWSGIENTGVRLLLPDGSDAISVLDLKIIGRYDYPWDAEKNANGQITGADEPALLCFGKPLSASSQSGPVRRDVIEAILIIPAGKSVPAKLHGNPENQKINPKDDHFGLRWETDLTSSDWDLQPIDWLSCVGADRKNGSGDFVPISQTEFQSFGPYLRPALGRKGDLTFDWAQSASGVEGVLQVFYPPHEDTPLTPPDAIKPHEEYKHDLVNFNELNVFRPKDAEAGEWCLNPWGQIVPVSYERLQSGVTQQTFRVNIALPSEAPIEYAREPRDGVRAMDSLTDVQYRKFYQERYARLRQGVPMPLRFELEHTYGVTTRIASSVTQTTNMEASFPFFADDLPAILAEPSLPLRPQGVTSVQATQTVPPKTPFLTVFLDEGGNRGNKDAVELRFNIDFLMERFLKEPFKVTLNGTSYQGVVSEQRIVQRSIWKAIAETAYCEKVFLNIRPLRFNYNKATASDDSALSAGLEVFGEQSLDITGQNGSNANDLRKICQAYLRGDFSTTKLRFELADVNGQRISRACNVVSFELDLIRHPNIAPPQNAWNLIRALPTFGRGKGQDVDFIPPMPNTEDVTYRAFNKWVELRKRRQLPIAPDTEQRQSERADEVRRAMGKSPAEDNAYWIFPVAPQTAENRDLIASVCPLGFVPIKRHKDLGADTDAVYQHFLRALRDVLSLRLVRALPTGINNTPEKWTEKFNEWKSIASSWELLNTALLSLAFPLYKPEDLRDELPYREAKELTQAVTMPGDFQYAAFREWLKGELTVDPATYSDAKAFLLSRLRTAIPQGGITQDFVALQSDKRIRPAGSGQVALIDADRFTYRDLLRTPNLLRALLFAEVLDDARYDNDFDFADFSAEPFETTIQTILVPQVNGNNTSIPVGDGADGKNTPSVPIAAVAIPQSSNNEKPKVNLASRKLLTAPLGRVALNFTQLQTLAEAETLFAAGRVLSRNRLEAGDVANPLVSSDPAQADIALVVRLRGSNEPGKAFFTRSNRRDDSVYSALFRVRGDEESELSRGTSTADDFQSLKNEIFYVNFITTDVPAEANVLVSPEWSEEEFKLFKTLLSDSSPSAVPFTTEQGKLLTDGALFSKIAAALQRADTVAAPADDNPSIQVVNGQLVVRASEKMEVVLFKPQNGEPSDVFYLLISIEPTAGKVPGIALQQTRNLGYAFRSEFGQSLTGKTLLPPAQPLFLVPVGQMRSQTGQSAAFRLKDTAETRTLTLQQLVNMALFDHVDDPAQFADPSAEQDVVPSNPPQINGELPSNNDEWLGWKGDVKITVHHHHYSDAPVAYINDQEEVESGRRLAFSNLGRIPLLETQKVDTASRASFTVKFPVPYRHFSLTILWTDPNNLGFFRIEDLQIHFV